MPASVAWPACATVLVPEPVATLTDGGLFCCLFFFLSRSRCAESCRGV